MTRRTKIKNKLIHMLGGVTKGEYFISGMVDRPCIIRAERPLITVQAARKYNPSQQPEEHVRQELVDNLVKKILDERYVRFWTEHKIDLAGDVRSSFEMFARIMVVDPN